MHPSRMLHGTFRILLLVLASGATALALPASAHAMRCGNRLVSRGDLGARVMAICGSPISVQRKVVYRAMRADYPAYGSFRFYRGPGRHRGGPPFYYQQRALARRHHAMQPSTSHTVEVPVMVEQWTYNLGPHRLMRVVHLEDGRVTQIETMGYGF